MTDDALGVVTSRTSWKRNPGHGSRNIANWVTLPLPFSPLLLEPGDFNGDGTPDLSNGITMLTPRVSGPLLSGEYDFIKDRYSSPPLIANVVDFDGDGDGDLLVNARGQWDLVRNLIINERSGVAARMRAMGTLGKTANPDEDADGDGRSNATEFIEGTDPKQADAPNPERSQPQILLAGNQVKISYEHRSDAEELNLSYLLERSSDLVNWTPVSTASATAQALGDHWQKLSLPAAAPAERSFYRVKSEHQIPVR